MVDYILHLHKTHDIPLQLSYSSGLSQFRSLRATHEIAVASAQAELAAHGFTWPTEFSAIDRTVRAEERNLREVVKDQKSRKLSPALTSYINDGSIPRATGTSNVISLLAPVETQRQGWSGGIDYLQGRQATVLEENRTEDARKRLSSNLDTESDPFGLLSKRTVARRAESAKTEVDKVAQSQSVTR